MDALGRALRFSRAGVDGLADHVEPFDRGTVLRTPSLPQFWSLNGVRLEHPEPELDLAGAAALAAEHVPEVAYRQIQVEDEATADRLMPLAREAGWTVEEELLMLLTEGPDRPADRTAIREGTFEEVVALLDVWLHEEYAEEQGPETVRQLVEGCVRQYERQPWQRFVATHDGEAVAMCSLLVRDGVAQVEDVYALPRVRGLGLGRAVIATVVEEARASGADVVFILADADGWPWKLYRKLGFTPLARRAELHRPEPGTEA